MSVCAEVALDRIMCSAVLRRILVKGMTSSWPSSGSDSVWVASDNGLGGEKLTCSGVPCNARASATVSPRDGSISSGDTKGSSDQSWSSLVLVPWHRRRQIEVLGNLGA